MSKIFSLSLMILAVIFAVSNKEIATVSLWPLPYDLQMPLVFIILIVFFIGFLAGSLTNWIGHAFQKKDPLD